MFKTLSMLKKVIPHKTISYVPNLNLIKPNFVVMVMIGKKVFKKKRQCNQNLKKWFEVN